jgi:hypothetical protein
LTANAVGGAPRSKRVQDHRLDVRRYHKQQDRYSFREHPSPFSDKTLANFFTTIKMASTPGEASKNFLVGGTMAFKSLLDPSFTYRNAASTDVRLTFDRIRREQRERRRQAELQEPERMGVRANASRADEVRVPN